MNKQQKFFNWIKENASLILAFLIPVIVLSTIFAGQGVVPFGDSIYLRSDCYHQYAPFYRELYRKITEGGSFTFSWNIGMGVNFSAIYSYYLASPINLLLGIIAPGGNVLITIDILIILKTGLCGFTMAYYLSKKYGKKRVLAALAGAFYAMSSYMAAFSWNIMWLDCLLLLPIVVLGIEKLVNEKKYLMYTIALGVAIFSNYYIAIMICIFSVLYFAVILFTSECKKDAKYFLSRVWLFGKYSLIAGGIGAAMILPAFYALAYTASGDMNFPEMWSNYFSILDMLSRSMIDVPVSIFNAHEPNLYCTVAVFLFVPLYCISEKVNRSEKIGKLILIAIFLISFNMNIPNYIWHGFHFPNSLPARESFIYIFLLITMAYEAVIHIKDFTTKQIGGCFAGAIALFVYIEEKYVNTNDYPFQIVYVSAIFLAAYFFVAILYKNKRINRPVAIYLAIVVCVGEIAINSTEDSAYSVTGYSYYFQDNDAITDVISQVDDKDIYRIEKAVRRTKNDAAWNDYHGVSIFSSTASSYFTDYLGYLGFEKSTNAYSFYGYTPFTAALLDVRYVIANDEGIANKEKVHFKAKSEDGMKYLYEYDYILPLGFMIPSYFNELWEMMGNNPFAVQNSFAETATGVSGMFTQLNASSVDKTSYIDVNEDADVFFYCTTYADTVNYTASTPDGSFNYSDSVSGLKHRQIVHVGEVPAGTTINVTTSDSDVNSLQLYAYMLNYDKLDQVMEKLGDETFNITEYDDTYIKGEITALEDGQMYTSIIYDEGWKAYVDGVEVEISSVKSAMLTVPVTKGTHTIELKYKPAGFALGWLITIGSILILVCCVLYDENKKKILRDKQKKEEEEKEDSKQENKQDDEKDVIDKNTEEAVEENTEEAVEESLEDNKE